MDGMGGNPMSSITFDVAPEVEARLRNKAERAGQDLPEYVRHVMEADAENMKDWQKATLAALDSFMQQDEEVHRDTLECLRVALDRDRPGQRSIFGTGYNPMPEAD
jgi:predicted DNA-binding protein